MSKIGHPIKPSNNHHTANAEDDRDLLVGSALMAIRTMVNKSTGYSAAKLLYGKVLRTPSIWKPERGEWVEDDLLGEIEERMQRLTTHVEETRREAKERSEEEARWHKIRYDATVYLRSYEPGDQILSRVLENTQVWQGVGRAIPSTASISQWKSPSLIMRIIQYTVTAWDSRPQWPDPWCTDPSPISSLARTNMNSRDSYSHILLLCAV